MRVLFDVNVVLDLLRDRAPRVTDAKPLLERVLRADIEGVVAATTITTIHYVARKTVGAERAAGAVAACMGAFEIAAVDRNVLAAAIVMHGSDFEDDVQIAAASATACDLIVTRDAGGFAQSPIPALAPADAMLRINAGQ